jgi:hypothetical protein
MTNPQAAVVYNDMQTLSAEFARQAQAMGQQRASVEGAQDAASVAYVSQASTTFQLAVNQWLGHFNTIIGQTVAMSEELAVANKNYVATQDNIQDSAANLGVQMSSVQSVLG